MMVIETSFANALGLHRSQRLQEAERAYRAILATEPNHPGALHLLGVIRQQQGRHEEALGIIGRAIAINPRNATFHNNYGAALGVRDTMNEPGSPRKVRLGA